MGVKRCNRWRWSLKVVTKEIQVRPSPIITLRAYRGLWPQAPAEKNIEPRILFRDQAFDLISRITTDTNCAREF